MKKWMAIFIFVSAVIFLLLTFRPTIDKKSYDDAVDLGLIKKDPNFIIKGGGGDSYSKTKPYPGTTEVVREAQPQPDCSNYMNADAVLKDPQGAFECAIYPYSFVDPVEGRIKLLEIMAEAGLPETLTYKKDRFQFCMMPKVYELLARAYLKKGELQKAVMYFDRIIASDCKGFEQRSLDGPISVTATGEGYVMKIEAYNGINENMRNPDYVKTYEPDYGKAILAEKELITKLDGVERGCWECCGSGFEITAMYYMNNSLVGKKAGFNEWMGAAEWLQKNSKNKKEIAGFMLRMGAYFMSAGDEESALKTYEKLAGDYPYLFQEQDVAYCKAKFYSLEAVLNMIRIYEKRKDGEAKIKGLMGRLRIISAEIEKHLELLKKNTAYGDEAEFSRKEMHDLISKDYGIVLTDK